MRERLGVTRLYRQSKGKKHGIIRESKKTKPVFVGLVTDSKGSTPNLAPRYRLLHLH